MCNPPFAVRQGLFTSATLFSSDLFDHCTSSAEGKSTRNRTPWQIQIQDTCKALETNPTKSPLLFNNARRFSTAEVHDCSVRAAHLNPIHLIIWRN
jgi:hypothetical protein